MDEYNVFIRNYDDEEDVELVTETPVTYSQAIAIDRGIEVNLDDDYYTEIKKA